ncbi:hypothetical protein [Variovorax fucosicus]|uniref:hypothetical protein n=1 Tax=Variovorax fucosicus TaxID=3053517 RepID=UPI0025750918|nr:hypothetical protein [Variovorax sp. J22G47]MDM0054539.1 hypothetical protein [Variovorax sp. J22G47]
MRPWRIAAVVLAASVQWTGAAAQVECPSDAQALPLVALFGNWEARFDGIPGVAMVQLARHPDYEGVRGRITRGGATAELAGDIDDEGLLTIDESQDGRAISATWSGAMQPGSCGRVFEGTWRQAADERTAHFVLRKTASGNGSSDDNTNGSKVKP